MSRNALTSALTSGSVSLPRGTAWASWASRVARSRWTSAIRLAAHLQQLHRSLRATGSGRPHAVYFLARILGTFGDDDETDHVTF